MQLSDDLEPTSYGSLYQTLIISAIELRLQLRTQAVDWMLLVAQQEGDSPLSHGASLLLAEVGPF